MKLIGALAPPPETVKLSPADVGVVPEAVTVKFKFPVAVMEVAPLAVTEAIPEGRVPGVALTALEKPELKVTGIDMVVEAPRKTFADAVAGTVNAELTLIVVDTVSV